MKALGKRFFILILMVISFHLLTPLVSFAVVEEGLLLVEGVTLGQGFNQIDKSEGIKLWDAITIRPLFRIQEYYDTNVFLDENDEKDDWITSIGAGGEAEMKMGDVLLEAGYLFDMNLFADHDNENNYNHTVIGRADWKLTDYEIIVKDRFRRFSSRSGSEDTSRVSRQNNVLSCDLLTERNRLAFDFGYDFVIEDYLSNEFISGGQTYEDTEDRKEHTFRGEVSYRFLPKTALLLEGSGGFVDYVTEFNVDSYFIQALGGLRGELLPNSVSDIKAGFRYQNYSEADVENYVGFVARSNTTKRFGDKDALTLSAEQSIHESTYSDINYYTLTHVGLGYIHQFNDKISGHLAGSYQINQYPSQTTEDGVTAHRYDNYYRAACGMRYDIRKWLMTAVAYEFTQRESRFAEFDYIDNRVFLSGMLQF